jgi:hypothetical protein
MARPPGSTTFTISEDDDSELERLCNAYESAPKAWLGGVLLRYGMRNVEQAMTELQAEAVEKIRRGSLKK